MPHAEASDLRRAYCNRCAGRTDHRVLGHKHVAYRSEQDGGDDGSRTWALVECCGCGEPKLLVLYREGYSFEEEESYFPPSAQRRRPQWYTPFLFGDRLFVYHLLGEIYGALDNGYARLVASGVRSLIEQIAIDQGGDGRTFEANLQQLQDAGHLSAKSKQRVAHVIDAGSAAVHRGYVPEVGDLHTMVDIAEHLVESIYVHDVRVDALAERTPPRPPRARRVESPVAASPAPGPNHGE